MSSNLSETLTAEVAPRRSISAKRAEKVQVLVEAALEELRAAGYEGLTVRNVARRAGVAPATAYTCFASKDHLVTEVFSRRLEGLADPTAGGRRSAAARVAAALDELARFIAAEPALAQACTVAMLSSDPDVERLRRRIGSKLHQRIEVAAGEGVDAGALVAIDLVVIGALVQAGMGHVGYDQLGSLLAEASTRILDGGVR